VEFFVAAPASPVPGELRYDRKGLSFDFRASDPVDAGRAKDAVELAYGSLALPVDRGTGELLGAWGYLPDVSWRPARLGDPAITQGRLRVRLVEVPPRGVALRLAAVTQLTAAHDQQSGWVRLGRTGVLAGTTFTEFARGCVAELSGTDLIAVWLRPTRA
jgi:hypothetical protein